MPSENEHITAFRNAVINKINEKIQAHDESDLSHADIRANLEDIEDYLLYMSETDINDLIDQQMIQNTASSVSSLQMDLMLNDLANEIAKE